MGVINAGREEAMGDWGGASHLVHGRIKKGVNFYGKGKGYGKNEPREKAARLRTVSKRGRRKGARQGERAERDRRGNDLERPLESILKRRPSPSISRNVRQRRILSAQHASQLRKQD